MKDISKFNYQEALIECAMHEDPKIRQEYSLQILKYIQYLQSEIRDKRIELLSLELDK